LEAAKAPNQGRDGLARHCPAVRRQIFQLFLGSMAENNTLALDSDSPTAAIFLDLKMVDQLYTCVASATGFHSYDPLGLFHELSDAFHPGHNYAAYLASCVRYCSTASRAGTKSACRPALRCACGYPLCDTAVLF